MLNTIYMNRKLWGRDHFNLNVFTDLVCSKCFTGTLYFKEGPGITSSQYFASTFRCSNSVCKQEYVCVGSISYYSDDFMKIVSKEFLGKKRKLFTPLNFLPTLRLFEIGRNIPSRLIHSIDKSFDTYWHNQNAAANAIRNTLEILMDILEIDNSKPLHSRIQDYAAIEPILSEMILAIKWIGNTGSHGENPTKADLLDAYEILEHCLNELFPIDRNESIMKMVQEINARKLKKVGNITS